jgi:DNA-binding HxlR family transcriptional regulator
VEYELTPKGLGLLPVIEEMRRFGRDWLVQDPDHRHD